MNYLPFAKTNATMSPVDTPIFALAKAIIEYKCTTLWFPKSDCIIIHIARFFCTVSAKDFNLIANLQSIFNKRQTPAAVLRVANFPQRPTNHVFHNLRVLHDIPSKFKSVDLFHPFYYGAAIHTICIIHAQTFAFAIRRGGALLLPICAICIRACELLFNKRSRAFIPGFIASTGRRHGPTGNSHSRASAPCDSRRSACLFRPLGAAGSGPSQVLAYSAEAARKVEYFRLDKKNAQRMLSVFLMESGSVLLSRAVSSQVPSTLKGLTSVFGMGTGGTLSP